MNRIKSFTLKNIPLHKILLALTLVYFLIFGLLMLQTLGQPDQNFHTTKSLRFSETWGIPAEELESDDPFVYTGTPYLAFWINGAASKIYHLIFIIENLNFFAFIFTTPWNIVY